MPAVPATAGRKSLSDFNRAKRERSLPARAPETQRAHPTLGLGDNPDGRQLAKPTNPRSPQPGDQAAPQDAHSNEPANDLGSAEEVVDAQAQPANDQLEQPDQEAPTGSLSDQEIIAKYREWEQSDLAPEEIFADKLHPVKVRGQERYVDYNELRQGYMRQADYTQRGVELKAKEAQVQQQLKSMQEHFAQAKDPDQFLEIYERNGYGDVLEKVAERVGQRRAEHRGLVIAAGRSTAERLGFTHEQIARGEADNHRDVVAAMQAADARLKQARQVEIENRKLQFERQRFEQERQAATHSQEVQKHQQTYQAQLNQLRPGAFKANGIPDNQGSRIAFLRHLGEVVKMEGLGEGGITRAQTMAAARALREELDDQQLAERGGVFVSAAEARAREQAKARQAALGPNRVATGAGKPLQAQQRVGKSASDFEAARRNRLLGR